MMTTIGFRGFVAAAVSLFLGVIAISAQTRTIEISAIAGLQFSPPRFSVEPGESVELTFSNKDTMLHNLLIVESGTREEVVELAMALGATGLEKNFIPESDKIILHTRLLGHNETQKITFQAPETEGVYPYVCTFPGHGTVMYGAMYVTRSQMPPIADDLHLPAQVRYANQDPGSEKDPAAAGTHSGANHAAARPDLSQHLDVPEGFEAVIFAQPPEVNYPTSLAASADGRVLFVGVDKNGSLGHRENMGSIVRAEDTDGDGQADAFSTFARIDSPRGVVWDGAWLYVLHPPDITRFRDTNGDGVADERELLVAGIGYGIEHPRGADHTTNGLRMGIDGWLYISVGDFGFDHAVGADGTELQLLGGGVARIRPDGSELEIFAKGTRNIYDTAISPTLDIFARDNSNDGQGWDTRLIHIVPTAEYGYPRTFTNFPDEALPPMVIYGGGSPTGSLFLDEPGWPAGFNQTLYTAEWNQDVVERHELAANGAGFTEEDRHSFFGIPSPTALVTDGRSNLFVGSWYQGGFNFGGPDVGFVARLSPESYQAPTAPDFATIQDADLLACLGSSSHTLRLFAQREILRRGENAAFVAGLRELASAPDAELAVRVAAIFTLKQLLGETSHDFLIGLLDDEATLEFGLRALTDRRSELAKVPAEPFIDALKDNDPRVRLQAVVGLGRLGRIESGRNLLSLMADEDPIVAHAAEKALVELEAVDAAFAALDYGGKYLDGARRVLQAIHSDAVVDGLFQRLESDQPREIRRATLVALARLYYKEWTGWTMHDWWGTQPDRRGPYYAPVPWERTADIDAVLRDVLTAATGEGASWLQEQFKRHRIPIEEPPNPDKKLHGEIIGTPGAWGDSDATREAAFDESQETFFDGPRADGVWVGLDLKEAHRIEKIRFAPRRDYENRLVGGRFQGSNDPNFRAATDLYVIENDTFGLTTETIDADESFRYVRYLSPDGGFGNIALVEFYGE